MSSSDIKYTADLFSNFAVSLIKKISDDLEMNITIDDKDVENLTIEAMKLSQHKVIDFTKSSEVIYLIQFAEELYSALFDLPQKDKNNLLDKSTAISADVLKNLKVSPEEKTRIIEWSLLIKILLNIMLKGTHVPKYKKTFPEEKYPTLMMTQSGGHLYNSKLNIIYLTKQSGGDSQSPFYQHNYGVNYATTGGGLPESSPDFYQRNYGVNYATTGGGSPDFYQRNYGVNYATTGGGSPDFYQRNYGVNYATTGGGRKRGRRSKSQKGGGLPTDMDRVPGFYVRNYWDPM